jgi:hypothetical protein
MMDGTESYSRYDENPDYQDRMRKKIMENEFKESVLLSLTRIEGNSNLSEDAKYKRGFDDGVASVVKKIFDCLDIKSSVMKRQQTK